MSGFILAAAIRADAELVWEGRSQHTQPECSQSTFVEQAKREAQLAGLRANAQGFADQALRMIHSRWSGSQFLPDGEWVNTAEEAARATRACYRACLAYKNQLAGAKV